jgi:hypothetical protein
MRVVASQWADWAPRSDQAGGSTATKRTLDPFPVGEENWQAHVQKWIRVQLGRCADSWSYVEQIRAEIVRHAKAATLLWTELNRLQVKNTDFVVEEVSGNLRDFMCGEIDWNGQEIVCEVGDLFNRALSLVQYVAFMPPAEKEFVNAMAIYMGDRSVGNLENARLSGLWAASVGSEYATLFVAMDELLNPGLAAVVRLRAAEPFSGGRIRALLRSEEVARRYGDFFRCSGELGLSQFVRAGLEEQLRPGAAWST